MADVERYLQEIMAARYGRDVRQSIHDSIDAINTQVTESESAIESAASQAAAAVLEAEESADNAEASAVRAEAAAKAAEQGSGANGINFDNSTRTLSLKKDTTVMDTAVIPGGGTNVEANPSGSGTTDLEKIKIDSTIYSIPQGGTDVEANPTGTATETLNKIEIDNTIYSISAGSSVDIVTSWETTPSDTKVPSEKLVKDSIPIVDASLNSASTNAIQNKAVNTALGSKASTTLVNNAIGTSSSYSSGLVYAVGDYCIYSNKLWVCTTSASGQTPSASSTYWKQVSLTSLNSTLTKDGTTKILYEHNGSALSATDVTVDNLSQFKTITICALGYSDAIIANNTIPYSIFSTFRTSGYNLAVFTTSNYSCGKYVNDTTINVKQVGSYGTMIYGTY